MFHGQGGGDDKWCRVRLGGGHGCPLLGTSSIFLSSPEAADISAYDWPPRDSRPPESRLRAKRLLGVLVILTGDGERTPARTAYGLTSESRCLCESDTSRVTEPAQRQLHGETKFGGH